MTYRPKYHISPPQGRLNDPNGVLLLGDQLHVFYQHDPGFGLAAKRTGWGHAATTLGGDGVWRHYPDALYPDLPYDAQGCYSGSAVAADGRVRLFYTGNVKRDGERFTSQNIVDALDVTGPMGGTYRRRPDNPAIDGQPEGYTAHFRDPQVSRDADGTWRMVLGAQRENQTGAVVVYTSTDLDTWEFAGEIDFVGLNYNVASAYMFECPNLLDMRDQATGETLQVIVFCPQFPDSDECGYVIGRLEGLQFEVLTDFTPLDYGQEFYAPQLIPFKDGALALGWMGLPGRDETPSFAAEGWVHQLTFPRALTLADGFLQTSLCLPVDPEGMVVERLDLGSDSVTAELVDVAGNIGAMVHWVPTDGGAQGTITLTVNGIPRWAECGAGECVFTADGAAVELTAGNGKVAFSSAVFAENGNDWALLRVI